MSSNIGNVPGVNPQADVQALAAQEATSPKAIAGKVSMDTTVGNMTELKTTAPEIYNAMMKGMADTIISDMKHRQARLVKVMREIRDRDKSG